MASDYGGPYRLHSTHSLHSARGLQPQCFGGYIGQEIGRFHHQHGLCPHPYPQQQFCLHPHPHPHPLSSAQSHDEVIQREIEKERIRREIIMSEIFRRRALEAEVRREMMREREMALKGGGDGFPFGPPSTMGLDLETRSEERFLDKRSVSVTQGQVLNNTREGGRCEPLPFQRAASNDVGTPRHSTVRDSEVKSVSGGRNQKKVIILQAKPIKNITGAKRASPESGASETQPDGNLKKKKMKKAKDEWSCALCQVIATSERGLNDHLKGKKHEMKAAALRGTQTKNSKIGLWTKKVAKHINPVAEVKLTSEPLTAAELGDVKTATDGPRPLQGNPSSDNLKKDESVVAPQVQKKDERKKEAHRFWCEMCHVGVATQKVMNTHLRGRKHKRQLQIQEVEKTVAEDAGAVKTSEAKTVEKD